MDLGVSGLASGFDWRSLVDQLTAVERTPQQRLRSEQSDIDRKRSAYAALKTQLGTLQTRVDALKAPSFFGARLASSSDATRATATASSGATVGAYAFQVTHRATAARWQGTADVGQPVDATVPIGASGFALPVSTGTFTVNGKQVAIETADTLENVLAKIQTATADPLDGTSYVEATYDAVSDRITLTHTKGENILLGAGADTSNFLQAARLRNEATLDASVTSLGPMGGVNLDAKLADSRLASALSGTGRFSINGTEFTYDAASDTLAGLLQKINESSAGVVASYDRAADRIGLANRTTGDVGTALSEVSGSFLEATGLLGGALVRGSDLKYTINGGDELTSQSNTIGPGSSGIAGLSVAVSSEGSFSVEVTADTEQVKTAIGSFIAEFNKTQALIDTQTASSTDAQGKVTAGILAGQGDVAEIAKRLRALAVSAVPGQPDALNRLDDFGYVTSGYSNSLTLEDGSALDQALGERLGAVQEFFANTTNGLAVALSQYLDKVAGDDGTLAARQDNLTRQMGGIDTQVSDMERIVQNNRQALINSFVQMETAQAQINQQLQFLNQRFGSTAN